MRTSRSQSCARGDGAPGRILEVLIVLEASRASLARAYAQLASIGILCWQPWRTTATRRAYARAYALQHASAELRADRVLAAVTNNSYALRHASFELRSDRAVVMAALARNGHALQHASPEFRADRAVVLAATANNGYALGICLAARVPRAPGGPRRGAGRCGAQRPSACACVSRAPGRPRSCAGRNGEERLRAGHMPGHMPSSTRPPSSGATEPW